jgi:hypothetical protein
MERLVTLIVGLFSPVTFADAAQPTHPVCPVERRAPNWTPVALEESTTEAV